jgi:hypothetical protein
MTKKEWIEGIVKALRKLTTPELKRVYSEVINIPEYRKDLGNEKS